MRDQHYVEHVALLMIKNFINSEAFLNHTLNPVAALEPAKNAGLLSGY